ncbi:MAG: hypothetical protein CL946_07750 [Ectothiorhodospiraceae bacterium]|nr:hypothetical protein [Ectothiorhodospiraceae bacterium]
MATNERHTPENEEFARLIQDLNAMPRVKAPENFEAALRARINTEPAPADAIESGIPWWKRFFSFGTDFWGIRIPAYAYGIVTAVIVVGAGIYYYNALDFGTELDKMQLEDNSLMNGQSVEDPETGAPAIPDDEEESESAAADNASEPIREAETSREAEASQFRVTTPGSGSGRQEASGGSGASGLGAPTVTPSPQPGTTPIDGARRDKKEPQRSGSVGESSTTPPPPEEDYMESQRGIYMDEDVSMEDEMKTDEARKRKNEGMMKEIQDTNVPANSLQQMESKSMYMLHGMDSADSLSLKDSLRVLDSLRKSKQR